MKMRVIAKRLKNNGFYIYSIVAPNGDIRYGFGNDVREICCPMPRKEFMEFLRKNPYYIK